jgi:hypothetical protein
MGKVTVSAKAEPSNEAKKRDAVSSSSFFCVMCLGSFGIFLPKWGMEKWRL